MFRETVREGLVNIETHPMFTDEDSERSLQMIRRRIFFNRYKFFKIHANTVAATLRSVYSKLHIAFST